MKKITLFTLIFSTLLLTGCGGIYTAPEKSTHSFSVGTGSTGELPYPQGLPLSGDNDFKDILSGTSLTKEKIMEIMSKNNNTDVPQNKFTAYQDYSEDTMKTLLQDGKRIVLFFYSSGCDTCKILDAEIQQKISGIPTDVVIVKVDYDTEKNLKKKYEVEVPHTLVRIDKDMNVTAKQVSGALNAIAILLQ